MASTPTVLDSATRVGEVRELLAQEPAATVFIRRVTAGVVRFYPFSSVKLQWLLESAPADVRLDEELALDDTESTSDATLPDDFELLEWLLREGDVASVARTRAAASPAPPPVSLQEVVPATYVNFNFHEMRARDVRTLPINEGFRAGSRYRLSVGITNTPDPRFEGESEQPPIEPPADEPVTLHVAIYVTQGPVRVMNNLRLRALSWDGSPTNATADFLLECEDVAELREARMDVFIYYRVNVIYAGRLRIAVAPDEYEWSRSGRPIRWQYAEDDDRARTKLFRKFSELGLLTARALNLFLQKGGNRDQYILTALVGRAELPARVEITRDEMTSFMVEAREMLDRLRRDPVYLRGGYDAGGTYTAAITGEPSYDNTGRRVTGAQKAFGEFLRSMALLGSRACDRLFRSTDGQILRAALRQHLQPGDCIQITIDNSASEFVWPWVWLYDASVDPSHRFQPDRNLFWGYRYVIEQTHKIGEFEGDAPVDSEVRGDPLKVRVGYWNFEPETKAQLEYFEQAATRAGGRIACTFWNDDHQWEEFLPSCDSQLLYFFSHGHTAKPYGLADASYYDMLMAWKKWVSEAPENESESMKAYRERALGELEALERDHGLLDESFIRLSKGLLLLRELYAGMNLSRTHPLVFLNMCESAQVFPVLKGGLIDAFLEKGARAVIGTEIPMIAPFADLMSREFFDALLFAEKPAAAGEILYRLRRKHLDNGNPLGFAYTLFGDAMVSIAGGQP
jgi:hypothetical protein